MLTSVKSDVKGDVKQECRKLWLVVLHQEFSVVGALVEQLGLLVDKVHSNKDVEFFGYAKVACEFPWPVLSGYIIKFLIIYFIDYVGLKLGHALSIQYKISQAFYMTRVTYFLIFLQCDYVICQNIPLLVITAVHS